MDLAPPQLPRWRPATALVLGVLGAHAWLLLHWPVTVDRGAPPAAARRGAVSRPLTVLEPAAAAKVGRSAPRSPAVASPRPDPVPTSSAPPRVARTAPPLPAAPPPAVRDAPPTDRAEPPQADTDGEGPPAVAPGTQPPPVYPTRMPDPARLRYALRMGVGAAARQADATLTWQHDAEGYRLALDADERGAPLIAQHSSGVFDAAGLSPEQFSDQRRGRRARSASFQRDSGRVTFSSARVEQPAWPGVQDRLGWIVQLAAIARAAGRVPPEVALFVVDARGAGDVWTFASQGVDTIPGPAGPVDAVRLLREPLRRFDWRIEAWLDPALDFWPVRLRMSLPGSGAVFELDLQGAPTSP